MSKGSEELLNIIKEIFPNQDIIKEYNVADRGGLFIDFYLPGLSIGFEFDGIQHYQYSEHFHGSREAFIASKKRDLAKSIACENNNISLVRIRYDDPMNKEFVLQKVEEALDE